MSAPARDLVFISYSHKDEVWLERLRTFLQPYEQEGTLVIWADPYIEVGSRWKREISTALECAGIGILLTTQTFLTSKFIAEVELPALLDAADRDLLTIIPIPVSTSTYKATRLKEFQWIRSPDKPLDLLPKAKRHAALVEIAEKIVSIANQRTKSAAAATPSAVPERAPAAPLAPSRSAARGVLKGVPPLPPHYLQRNLDLPRLKQALLEGLEGAMGITGAAFRPGLGLHGQGGIGKSVLAAALTHDDEVRRAFPDGIHWLTLGQTPDVLQLQARLAEDAGGNASAVRSLDEGRRAIAEALMDRSFLLVLDDVWDSSHARAFDVLSPHSRLLITTRDGTILTALGAREESIQRLPEDVALELLARWARVKVEALPDAAHRVAEECGYLPLALSVAGARVRDGLPWDDLLHALEEGRLEFLDHPYSSVFRSLRLSVDALPEPEQARYLELAVFPEDVAIPQSVIIAFWKHTGGLDAMASRDLLGRLERRALLERVQSEHGAVIALHDLQHDFIRLLTDDLPALHGQLADALAAELPATEEGYPAWHLLPPDEPYSWLQLGEHLVAAGRREEFRELLLDPRWLEAKLDAVGMAALLSDFEVFPGDLDLSEVVNALRKYSRMVRVHADRLTLRRMAHQQVHVPVHFLVRPGEQLHSQLLAYLLDTDREPVRRMLRRVAPEGSWLRPLKASLSIKGEASSAEQRHSGAVNAVAITPDGQQVVSGANDLTCRVWELESGTELHTVSGHTRPVSAVAITRDTRQFITASLDELRVWDLGTGVELHSLRITGPVLTITGHGHQVVSRVDQTTLKIWDVASGAELLTLSLYPVGPVVTVLTPDGRYAAVSEERSIKVWDLEHNEILYTMRERYKEVAAVAITRDGRQVVSASWDQTLDVWDLEGGQGNTFSSDAGFSCCAITVDGATIVAGDRLGRLHFLRIEGLPDTRAQAPERQNRGA